MDISPASLPWQDAYKLLVGSILPRPIAFVSTIDEKAIANAAPFSFFTAICADPMLVCFSPMRRGTDGAKKDTLVNIEKTKEFVINIVSESILEQMNECAPEFKPEVDEFEKAGLTKLPSMKVRAPRIAESLVHIECELYQVLHFGDKAGSGSLVIGKVVHFHVHDDLYDSGRILTEGLNPIGRMAGHSFTKPLDAMFELVRKTQTSD
ncbi:MULTISPECIES: flavin reductase family protein [unclassified Bacillus (in: firmicutes)]|uniref:flavin reductase family protein n=1 Tax=unclassified Bacillus (in: firmicutes) TaxID=185979 RepID=UPI0008E766E9|nr:MULTISPECIES: flavin reductase family protein [unclassified Bacillus (in: firmicutes)]SFA88592.1 NADH-FMN oxidoreductase RutF, flavin reductase (DIM6/NTAB) family [Bacillus sp. UNCCL13]SFQ84649.1 NADH-FMN oxidoreductase RutF, flavin reductase (DIM6/NTAB) family [Bacillus sp. cl95]